MFTIFFPVAGISTSALLPPLVAFVLSFFTSMGGVSGAFLLLPFQMSVLGFTSPSVSATNFLYNIVGTPGGIIRYVREKRMVWPLAGCITVGTLPGVLLGYYLRVRFLPDPRGFKLFVGLVLAYIGLRLLKSVFLTARRSAPAGSDHSQGVENISCSWQRLEYEFHGQRIVCPLPVLFLLTIAVGVIGGIYGIGGGAIIAPFCVSILGLPVYTVAGAALFGTFVTSISGVFFYSTIPLNQGMTAPPDWLLGLLFGLGGLAGMYLGARCQKFVPERVIKAGLALIVLSVAGRYIIQYF
ncbi:MAG: sulfite exporter TauE/SafE family protein [Desulfobacterales bacterium]|nr:sulfite exporter TauE/SafE family protein [Desulfobacterales bacterium]